MRNDTAEANVTVSDCCQSKEVVENPLDVIDVNAWFLGILPMGVDKLLLSSQTIG